MYEVVELHFRQLIRSSRCCIYMGSAHLVGGIDIGSSSMKWTIYDYRARQVVDAGKKRYPYDLVKPDTIDVDGIFTMFREQFQRMAAENVSAVGLSCMAPIMIAVDSNFESLLSIPYNSLAGSELFGEIGSFDFKKHTLNPLNVQMFPQKILWGRNNLPDKMREAAHFVDLNGFLFNKMWRNGGGTPLQDIATAAEWGLVDVPSGDWWSSLVEHLGIRGKLPKLVRPEYSRNVDGVSLCIGTVDTLVSSLGAIGTAENHIFASNGSTLCAGFVSRRPVVTDRLYCDLYFSGRYLINGCNSQYFTLLEFAKRVLDLDIDVDEIESSPTGLIFIPYLQGERCPIFDTDIRGGFYGFGPTTTRADIATSIAHALAYLSADMFNNLIEIADGAIDEVVAGGGLTKKLIGSIASTISGLNYRICNYDTGTLGAAIMALKATGVIADYPADASAFIHDEGTVLPATPSLKAHIGNYRKFIEIRERLKGIKPPG